MPGLGIVTPGAPEVESELEEVFGPNYPLMGDVPILANGVVRVVWVPAAAAFAVEALQGGEFVEQGRVTVWRENAGATAQFNTVLSRDVREGTPERAIVHARLGIAATDTADVYLTLQRGWAGPRIEAYGAWSTVGGKPGVRIQYAPAGAGAVTLARSSGSWASGSTSWSNNDLGSFTGLAPWLNLLPPGALLGVHGAVVREAARLIANDDVAAYGATRKAFAVSGKHGTAAAGYASMFLGFGPRATIAGDAADHGKASLIDVRAIPELVAR